MTSECSEAPPELKFTETELASRQVDPALAAQGRAIGLVVTITAGLILLYISRFWTFGFWSRDAIDVAPYFEASLDLVSWSPVKAKLNDEQGPKTARLVERVYRTSFSEGSSPPERYLRLAEVR